MSCCSACLPARGDSALAFSNTQASARGDKSVPNSQRIYLGIVFPESVDVRPLHMFFAKRTEGTKVLEAACAAAGVTLDRGRLVGSPERLNLFTVDGDLLRLDLELEAHLGSTLQPSSLLVLEKGNRIDPYRLEQVRQSALQQSRGACAIM